MAGDINKDLAIMEQHAEQCRAEAFAVLFHAGEEYTEKLMDVISRTVESDNPNQRLIGLLAEIGICTVLSEIARSSMDELEGEP